MKNKLTVSVLMILLTAFAAGCGRNESGPAGKIVARINNYELTTDDFRDEAKLIIANKYFSGSPEKMKEDILDEMINKKVLLQEAQRKNFDKDAAFMKEIERYWEQALLKLLIREKMGELSRRITVSAGEVLEEYNKRAKEEGPGIAPFDKKALEIKDDLYNRKMQESLDEWMRGLRKKADIKIYKENL